MASLYSRIPYQYPLAGSGAVYIGTIEVITAFLFDFAVSLVVFGFVLGAIKLVAHTIAVEEEYRGPDAADPDYGTGVESSARGAPAGRERP